MKKNSYTSSNLWITQPSTSSLSQEMFSGQCYLTLTTKSDSNFLYGAIIYQFILSLSWFYINSRKYKSNKLILYFIAWYFDLFLIASLRLWVLRNLIKIPLNHINKFNHLIGIGHYFFVLIIVFEKQPLRRLFTGSNDTNSEIPVLRTGMATHCSSQLSTMSFLLRRELPSCTGSWAGCTLPSPEQCEQLLRAGLAGSTMVPKRC